jgi:hypothetical protein
MGLGFRFLNRESDSDGAEEVCLRWNGLSYFLVYGVGKVGHISQPESRRRIVAQPSSVTSF